MKCFLCGFMGYEDCEHCEHFCRKNTLPANVGYEVFSAIVAIFISIPTWSYKVSILFFKWLQQRQKHIIFSSYADYRSDKTLQQKYTGQFNFVILNFYILLHLKKLKYRPLLLTFPWPHVKIPFAHLTHNSLQCSILTLQI